VGNNPVNWYDPFGLIRYGFYGTVYDRNTFEARAIQGAGRDHAFGFDSGQQLLADFEAATDITRADIHSHAWEGGLVGDGELDNGFYRDFYAGKARAAKVRDFIERVKGGRIDLAKGAEINFFGCNTDSLAQELSAALGVIGRGDARVTGATNSVYPKGEIGAAVDHDGRFNTYEGGKFVSSTTYIPYR
jgi:hypothetical protein